ncbi:TPA: hypothetical protein RQN06_000137 [Aeromonas veronii]|uniref:hypothetical protein n=1 Tax=Aeromonas TaxID=642 RepID=UPI0020B2B74B|nr:hypothetical protein [Aeromonas hydrophila]MCP3326018.1 hypothetical protein [Aeromonas hydrophila]HDX8348035.1 hypothetical protein [Aeromonas veronii]
MLLMHAFLHDYKAELRAGCVKLANRQAGVASSLFLIRTNGAQRIPYSVLAPPYEEHDVVSYRRGDKLNTKKARLLTKDELDALREDMIKASILMRDKLLQRKSEKLSGKL